MDIAGNVSTIAASASITVDRVAPEPTTLTLWDDTKEVSTHTNSRDIYAKTGPCTVLDSMIANEAMTGKGGFTVPALPRKDLCDLLAKAGKL